MTSTNAIEASAALSLAEVAEVAGVALPARADARAPDARRGST